MDRAALQHSVLSFLENYSIEATPHSIDELSGAARLLRPGAVVYVAHPPKCTHDEIIATVRKLTQLGFEPVPHIVARRLRDQLQLDDFLSKLAAANVRRALLVGGDLPEPVGNIHDSLQVLKSGALGKHGIRTIGVAGHPDGSQWIDSDVLRRALRDKAEYARQNNKRLYVVSQFGFDASSLFRFEAELRASGIELEIHAGLTGKTPMTSLLRYARRCGVGASTRIMAGTVRKLFSRPRLMSIDQQIVAIGKHRLANPESKIVQAHFFPFGDMSATLRWLNAVLAGEFIFTGNKRGISVLSTT